MFFKEVRDKNKAPGKVYVYYMLVRSYRDERGVSRDRVLLNAGKLPYSRQELQWLAQRISEILSGEIALDSSPSTELEGKAQELAARVLERQLKIVRGFPDAPTPELLSVEPHRLRGEDARSVAGEQILVHLSRELGFEQAFRQATFSKKQARLATALTVARALKPAPLPDLVPWLAGSSAVDELLGLSLSSLTLPEVQRVARKLVRRRPAICSVLRAHKAVTRDGAGYLLDLRHCFVDSTGKRWLLGLGVDQDGFPAFPVIVPPGRNGNPRAHVSAVEDAIRLHVFQGLGASPVAVLNEDGRCSAPLRPEQLPTSRYVLLRSPLDAVARALQDGNGVAWHPSDHEWALVASPSRKSERLQGSSGPDHVLLRTNLPASETHALESRLAALAELEADLAAVQPLLSSNSSPPGTVEAELFLSFLALVLVRALRLRLKTKGHVPAWPALRDLFASQTRLTLRVPDPFGTHTHYIRMTTRPGERLARLYDALDLRWDMLGNRYFSV